MEKIDGILLKIEDQVLDAFAKNRQDNFKHSGAAVLTSVGHGCKRAFCFATYGLALLRRVTEARKRARRVAARLDQATNRGNPR
jgi:hypothetical protein